MKDAEKRTEFLTARQLADILQVSETTIHRLRRQGRIPAIKVTNRLIRFNLRDVKAALADATKKNPSEATPDDRQQLSFDEFFSASSQH
ncbi:MAG: helix-turn-helix domain-containing protein [Acidobacteriota bacterium]|nr:helix-turn-helix domain-containing protein [Blastocatellia bacterium]MDW8238644.1 helix-turn-helix domain-containing protein [Acidobacteriota bacterium]